jgi:hypothetical protein
LILTSSAAIGRGLAAGDARALQEPAVSGSSAGWAGAREPRTEGVEVYEQLKRFALEGGSATVENLTLKRDRAEMTFTGTFYFEAPVAGAVRGAVFIGQGNFRATTPPSEWERDHVKRMLKADNVESDFRVAVLRFTDDSFDLIGKSATPGAGTAEAAKLAEEFEPRMLRETGLNVSSRLAVSILNRETPGFFLAQFDRGRRSRFALVLDRQSRIPASNFSINGGEKGLIFAPRGPAEGNDIWMAFYSEEDYKRGTVEYSDVFDLVQKPKYTMTVDLREPRKAIKVNAQVELVSQEDNLRAIPFVLTEGLPEFDQLRKKKGMRITAARLDGQPIAAVQEEWEGGLLVTLPSPRKTGERFTLELDVEGNFIYDRSDTFDCHFPFINGEWYPRHGYLSRSKFEISFLHQKKHRVAGPGVRVKEEISAQNSNEMVTVYRMDEPVALVTFAMGPYKLYEESRKLREGELPVEFYSLPGSRTVTVGMYEGNRTTEALSYELTIKEDFVMAEMGNAVDYMGVLFGKYPYPVFRAAFHPFGFGQGFATMLAIPNADRTSKYTFRFLAHETAHQWWGNIVSWRSYRDQWLSEGFAHYSGTLYTGLRQKPAAARELFDEMRDSLKNPPRTRTGMGTGRLADVGPIILGHRLNTRETLGAYTTLIYNKGALVLRMLHFLLSDPATGNDKGFFEMMRDFVKRHHNDSATTDSFREVANEHFARSPLGRKYGLQDLNWFFSQWLYQAQHPSYRLEYQIEDQPDGSVMLKGTVFQENAPEQWFMPLPLVMQFGKDQVAKGTVHALGPKTPVNVRLPARPSKVELDPEQWILSEKTTTRGR